MGLSLENLEKDKLIQEWLESHCGTETFRPGLERIRPYFLQFISNFSKKKIVTIGGTNGKGQTSHFLGRLLKEEGISYALWTSPHVLTPRERFIHNGDLISSDSFKRVLDINEKNISKFSYYEYLFLSFCEWANTLEECEVIIFEVGLGGRGDAVNLFEPTLTSIVSISRDHIAILGDNISMILNEKLGITRQGVPLVTGPMPRSLDEELSSFCAKNSVPLKRVYEIGDSEALATYPERNLKLAKLLFEKTTSKKSPNLRINDFKPSPGRMEKVTLGDGRFIFIGAHNLDGLENLVQSAVGVDFRKENDLPFDEIWVSLSRPSVEEAIECLTTLANTTDLCKKIKVMPFEHNRAMNKLELEKAFIQTKKLGSKKIEWHFSENISKEITDAIEAGKRVLVTGSYYFIGNIQFRFHTSHL